MEYIPNTDADRRAMLEVIGASTIEELLADIPAEIRHHGPLQLPPGLSEMELRAEIESIAAANLDPGRCVSFLGAGAYDHYIPSALPHLIGRSEFFTSYTPYQAEMSQGLLQSIYEYQTMIAELTGTDTANASMYDGASALAEAALMSARITKRGRIVLSGAVHPRYRRVMETYLSGLEIPCVIAATREGVTDASSLAEACTPDTAAVVVQYPNVFGCLENLDELAERAHAQKALLVVAADPIALGILEAPGKRGADIVVGEGQGLGNALSYGGPYLGFFATKREFMRQLPGRIVGATVDAQGRRGYCLTLQTREQHIRREKATSNICTNQALNALAATVYLALVGREGLKEIATLCAQKAHYAHSVVTALPGFKPAFAAPFFKEFVVKTPLSPAVILDRLLKSNILGGVDFGPFAGLPDHLLICVTEKRTRDEIDRLAAALGETVA